MQYTVTSAEDGQRLGTVLRSALQLSSSAIRRAKWNGRILLNGESARTVDHVAAGDVVSLLPETAAPAFLPRPYALEIPIAWRGGDLLIVDKPAPLASQSGKNHPDDSLENALYWQLGCPEGFVYRPVNRLDKGTSGLMAVALTGEEQARMQRHLHTDLFRRVYLAVTDGLPPAEEGVIDFPIGKADGATIRRECRRDGKPCLTRYRVEQARGDRALLRLELETGRTHQIRVHLSALGCPVFGDFLYGTESPDLPGRFALHSAEITFPTLNGESVHLSSPLPEALAALMRS